MQLPMNIINLNNLPSMSEVGLLLTSSPLF